MEGQKNASGTPANWLMRVLHGALIGVGSILPGVSGGVLCVLFGIYQPMMALLAHPFKTFKTYYRLFIPVGIGFVLGFIGLAKVVEWMFGANETIATCLFFGLIVGTLPSLWREAGAQGRGKSAYTALIVSFIALFCVLCLFKFGAKMALTPTPWWFLFCGIVWGMSLVVPGLSSSSILLFMGLYEPMTAGIGRLDMGVIVPLVAGIAITAFSCARMVNHLLEKHYAIAYHVILGVVCASTLLIIPLSYGGTTEILLSLLCAIAGFLAAGALERWNAGMRAKNNID